MNLGASPSFTHRSVEALTQTGRATGSIGVAAMTARVIGAPGEVSHLDAGHHPRGEFFNVGHSRDIEVAQAVRAAAS